MKKKGLSALGLKATTMKVATKVMMTALMGALVGIFSGSEAQARGGGSGVLFDVNLYYASGKVESKNTGGSSTVSADGSTAIYDIKLGLLSGSGLYWGGIYTSRSSSILNQSGSSGSALGASIGYMGASGFFVMGHYLLNATEGDYKNGSGLQADFGYKAGVGSGWLVGAELSYRSMTYKESDSNASLEYYKKDEVIPMISVGYLF